MFSFFLPLGEGVGEEGKTMGQGGFIFCPLHTTTIWWHPILGMGVLLRLNTRVHRVVQRAAAFFRLA